MVELWVTTPEKWGPIFTIRTGSAAFSHWLVSPRKYFGGCPGGMSFKDGSLYSYAIQCETPEEADVFKLLDLAWIEPRERCIEGAWGKMAHPRIWLEKHPEA